LNSVDPLEILTDISASRDWLGHGAGDEGRGNKESRGEFGEHSECGKALTGNRASLLLNILFSFHDRKESAPMKGLKEM
jgi:hypothetical protein